jgi:uncharacterized protein YndB with AHSA1/START domain
MNDYGELIAPDTVRFERTLPGPIERVWGFLIESDKRGRWFCGGDTELEVGGHVDMHFHNAGLSSQPDIPRPEKYKDMPERLSFTGTVTACDPPRLLSHSWDFEGESSEVSYELKEQDDKVLLVLTHRRLRSRNEILSICGGWHTHLDILVAVMAGEESPPFWKCHSEFEDEYERRI